MATGKWQKKHHQKKSRSFSHFFACFRLFSSVFALFRSFSYFLSGLFLTVFGRPFSHFLAPFACCHLAAAIWIPLNTLYFFDFTHPRFGCVVASLITQACAKLQCSDDCPHDDANVTYVAMPTRCFKAQQNRLEPASAFRRNLQVIKLEQNYPRDPCFPLSGISKPRFCQAYVLQFGAFHEDDGNHENDENDEDNSNSHKQGG